MVLESTQDIRQIISTESFIKYCIGKILNSKSHLPFNISESYENYGL